MKNKITVEFVNKKWRINLSNVLTVDDCDSYSNFDGDESYFTQNLKALTEIPCDEFQIWGCADSKGDPSYMFVKDSGHDLKVALEGLSRIYPKADIEFDLV